MLIGSLVELHVGLHSCLCFSLLEKLVLKASSTPPRYLAVCRASSAFSYRNLNSFLTPGGSIEKVLASLIASRHLVDRSSFCSCICWFVPKHLYLSKTIFSTPSLIDGSTPLDTFIYQDLLRHYIYSSCDPQPISFDLSLDSSFFFFLKQSHLTPILILKVSSSFLKILFTW